MAMYFFYLAALLNLAQADPPSAEVRRTDVPAAPEERERIEIPPGKSAVLELAEVPVAVSITDTDVATVQTLGAPTLLLVQGKRLGSTDMLIVFNDDRLRFWDIQVSRDLTPLSRTVTNVIRHGHNNSKDESQPSQSQSTRE